MTHPMICIVLYCTYRILCCGLHVLSRLALNWHCDPVVTVCFNPIGTLKTKISYNVHTTTIAW